MASVGSREARTFGTHGGAATLSGGQLDNSGATVDEAAGQKKNKSFQGGKIERQRRLKKEKYKRSKRVHRLVKFEDGHAIYDVEPEVPLWAAMHAKFIVDRYRARPNRHWEEDEAPNSFTGFLGQKLFDIILQQYNVPNDRNDPIIENWYYEKPYDFIIPNFGTIEVKTFGYGRRKVLIKKSEWHGNDYIVAFRFMDRQPKKVEMMGWLTKDEVEHLLISKKGEEIDGICYTPKADAYTADFNQLRPAEEFIEMLKKYAIKRE
jgi:hypothetical protein